MSFGGDLRWHTDGVRRVLRSFLDRPPRYPKVEREGATRDGRNHFIEFYNERGEPSPEGLLRTVDHFWTVVIGDGFVAVPIWSLRKWAYPHFERWVDWGGDDKAFAGKLVPLTKLVAIMKDPPTEAEREQLHWQTERLIAAPPPIKPAEQANLFG